mmetsp:Transcript_7985/g.18009  ORF Transcript_7985/g.18009 Transcript_7985/m.18009 type:complete len:234 (-) Transcript_7985:182-883(-)
MKNSSSSKAFKASSSKSGKKFKSKSKYTPLSPPSVSQSMTNWVSHDESKSGTGSKSSKSTKNSKSKLVNINTNSSPQMQMRSYIPDAPAESLEDGEKEARDARLHLEAASILYQAISSKYDPVFFDRSQGWAGKTFSDAAVFCNSHYPKDAGYGVPCPHEAYCPEGPNSLPFGGYRTDLAGEGIYAPIIDETEHWLGWVQISDGHPCTAYNYLNPEPNEEQTGHIMCCRDISR